MANQAETVSNIGATVPGRPGLPAGDGSTATHVAFLDGLRALCALYVVLHHWSSQYCYNPAIVKNTVYAAYGHFAVDVFIVISGFCLMLPVARHGVLREGSLGFIKRRAWRILPPYYLAMAASLLLILLAVGKKTGTHWDCSIPVTLPGLISHVLLVQDLSGNWAPQINHAMWSISVEWRIYFFFPLFVLVWRKWGSFAALGAGTAVTLSYYAILHKLHIYDYYATCPQYILLFMFGFIGAAIAYMPERSYRSRLLGILPFFCAATLAAVAVNLLRGKLGQGDHYAILQDFMAGLFAISLICFAAISVNSAITRLLSWKPLAFVGTFAYSLYLIHAPLLQCEWLLLRGLKIPDVIAFPIGCIVGIPLIVATAYVFFWFCERPFLGRRRVVAKS